jgi:hypothetical protein
MSMQGPELVPVKYEDFLKIMEQVSRGGKPTIALVEEALSSVFNNPEVVQQMIRQSQSQYGKQAKSAPELNPQNAPQAVAQERSSGFQPHPALKDYLGKSVAQTITENKPQVNNLLNSFEMHNSEGEKAFNELRERLQNKLKNSPKFKPMPSSSKKLKPE